LRGGGDGIFAVAIAIHVSPRLEQNAFVREIRQRIQKNLERKDRLDAFERMWGTVVLVSRPNPAAEAPSSSPPLSTLTLRFDYGTLTIHEGRVGRPDLTLWGAPENILKVTGRRMFASDVGLEVFGRGTHPRFAYRFGRLLDAS
jgi:hypothetical protein